MSRISFMLWLVIAPLFTLYLGCLGVEMIGKTALGWALLLFGIGYPAGAIIYYHRLKERVRRSRQTAR